MDMVANKCTPIIGLSLYVERCQCCVQGLDKQPILCCKPFTQLSVEIGDLLVLGISVIVTNLYVKCSIAAVLTKVLLSSLFLFVCSTTLDTRGLESTSSSWTLSQVTR